MKRVLILCGGASAEHDISLLSKDYLVDQLQLIEDIEISVCTFPKDGSFPSSTDFLSYDFVIPCFHGYPGETGDIQSFLEMNQLPYLGSNPEGHKNCFNKVTTKLYFESLKIPVTDSISILSSDDQGNTLVSDFFDRNPDGIFIKSSRQGSSVGCSVVRHKSEIDKALKTAFLHDSLALVEPFLENVRELELSVFEYQGEVHVTEPGEITTPLNTFYSFDQKYSSNSESQTHILAELPTNTRELIKQYAKKAFVALELRDLSRVDFFLCKDGKIYLNEINTFPGLTPISMFPKMMENYGVKFYDFLKNRIK